MFASEKFMMTEPTRYAFIQIYKKVDHIVLTTLYTFFYIVKLFCKHCTRICCLLSINKSKSEEFTYDEEVFVVELFDCLFQMNCLFFHSAILFLFILLNYILL